MKIGLFHGHTDPLYGICRGPELTNQAATAVGWTVGSGWSVPGNGTIVSTGGFGFSETFFTLPASVAGGRRYEISFTLARTSGGNLEPVLAAATPLDVMPGNSGVSGTYKFVVTMPAGGGNRLSFVNNGTGDWVGTISGISVKEVT